MKKNKKEMKEDQDQKFTWLWRMDKRKEKGVFAHFDTQLAHLKQDSLSFDQISTY